MLVGHIFFIHDCSIAQIKVSDKLTPAGRGKVKIEGYLGKKLDSCIINGIMAADYSLYCVPFKVHNDDPRGWRGEFWGKWFTSAALAYSYQPTAQHINILDKAVSELLVGQEMNGRLSSYKNDFGYWDIWGRKYALLGLIAYYDQTGDKKALMAASRSADNIIDIAGPGKTKLTETGLSLLEGLSSNSILEPIVLLYERTNNKKYLDFAKYLVSLWSEPNAYNPRGQKLIEDAMNGADPIHISSPKGYEQMSCYEGICELYRATGDKKYFDALVTYANNVLKKEIMIVGSGSSGELWCDGANRQTEFLEQPMETCVTATWMKFCYQLLRITGNPVWADEMEITLYNALLGAMTLNGKWWAYFSPLAGERMPSPVQVPSVNSSCCVVNGPRGLMTVPAWSVMGSELGPVVNLYAQGIYSFDAGKGNISRLVQETNYPESDSISIELQQEKPLSYTISLRIPSWSKQTKLSVNGESIPVTPGTYVKITRRWKDKDKIKLKLDLRGRVITAPGSVNHKAIIRGPVVLALDSRLVQEETKNLWLLPDNIRWHYDKQFNTNYVLLDSVINHDTNDIYIELKPSSAKPEGIWMAFETPFLYRPTHFFNHAIQNLTICDYASAGNQYTSENLFRVWIPQPIYMNDIFPKNTWHLLFYEGNKRPGMPK